MQKSSGYKKFDVNRSSKDLQFSADQRTITRYSDVGWSGAFVEGFLQQTGESELCIRATRASGRMNMSGVMFGLASDRVPLGELHDANQILINLWNGEYFGGAANHKGLPKSGAADVNDVLKAVYDADANTLAFYRNGRAWGRTFQLNQNTIANKAKLMFFVSIGLSEQSVTIV